jgi:uncharacterized protein (DUF58 family)
MLSFLRRRWRQWWEARLAPTERITLTQRNIFIVPTRAGLAFCLTLLLLLLASINYQLNLGYLLTFLLAGSALASMHMTHGSLRGLSLHLKPPAPCHAGSAALLEVVVTNSGAARHGLGFGAQSEGGRPALAWAEVDARGQSHVTVACLFERRGHPTLPLLRIESRFPFGLFRAWALWRPAGRVWVYPAPEHPSTELPPAQAMPGDGRPLRAASGGEFDGVRAWRRGDALRQIVWKKVARTGTWISRDARESTRQQLWLDWADTRLREPEARLSRLTAWVLAAEAQGLPWGLRLPGYELPPAEGHSHPHDALQALASWTA